MAAYTTSGSITNGGVTIACETIALSPDLTKELVAGHGLLTPIKQINTQSIPKITITTKDVIGFLGRFGLLANKIEGNAVDVYMNVFEDQGTLASLATRFAIAKGLVVIDSIQASIGAVATLNATIYPTSADGFASPITYTEEGAAMPTLTVPTKYLSVGTAQFNGAAIPKTSDISISTGNTVDSVVHSGGYYPRDVLLTAHNPVISISSFDPKGCRTIFTEKAKAITSTTSFTLLETSTDGVISNVVGKTFTVAKGQGTMGDRSGSNNQKLSTTIEIVATYDATNAAVEIS